MLESFFFANTIYFSDVNNDVMRQIDRLFEVEIHTFVFRCMMNSCGRRLIPLLVSSPVRRLFFKFQEQKLLPLTTIARSMSGVIKCSCFVVFIFIYLPKDNLIRNYTLRFPWLEIKFGLILYFQTVSIEGIR